MWEYFLGKEMDTMWMMEEVGYLVCHGAQLPICIVLELASSNSDVALILIQNLLGLKMSELLVHQLVELLQSVLIYQFIQLKHIMRTWGTCLLICLNPTDIWCGEEA